MIKIVISSIPMFVTAFWSIVLLLEYKNANKSKVFLGVFMLISFLLYVGHASYFNQEYSFYAFWENIYLLCSLAVYPLYFIYIKLISQKMVLEIKDFLLLIPSVLMFVFSLILYVNMTSEDKVIFTQDILYHNITPEYNDLSMVLKLQIIKIKLFKLIFFIQLFPIVFLGRKYILEYNKKIRNYYSDTEGKTLNHFNKLLYIFIITSLASSVANVMGKSFFVHSTWLLLIPALIFGFLLFLIGYIAYNQEFTLQSYIYDIKSDEVRTGHNEGIRIHNIHSDNNQTRLLEDLIFLLEKEEIYKKTDLRITDISNKLNTNRTYISKVVNEDLNTNFCDLINKYRIENAKKLLKENDCKSMGLSQIGELSGFKSDSSFYRIFKEKEGISPGDFRKTDNSDCD